MALTRPMLKGMGLTEEQVNAIIEAHTESIEALKAQRDKYKEDAEKLPNVEDELKHLKETGGDWQSKYETEHSDFEQYKKQIVEQEDARKVKSAYEKLLVNNNVGNKYIDSILGVTDYKSMSLDENGTLKDESKIIEDIKSKWAGFITSSHDEGADVETPPAGGNKMTKEAFEQMSLSERMEYANEHATEVAEFFK